jgi:cyanophycin synthetase
MSQLCNRYALSSGKSCRIPIIAVTGTNGKTTTTRLLAHIVKKNGYKVGFTTSDGIYIQNHMMEKEILQVLKVHNVLRDPTVEFAVLETAREVYYALDLVSVFVISV